MKDEEKNLIENLFYRLKNAELNSSERDVSAEKLIQNLVSKQPASPYYMTQTILIQETAIKKMGIKIEELEKKIKILNTEISNKKPSFLSNFFKTNTNSSSQPPINNDIWRNKENTLQSQYSNSSIPQTTQSLPIVNNTATSHGSSGFLSSALQTATGVAGGMILGNMLMSIFNNVKSDEEIFDSVHQSASDNYIKDDISDNNIKNDLVNYTSNDIDDINSNKFESVSEDLNNDISDSDDFNNNDDNFI